MTLMKCGVVWCGVVWVVVWCGWWCGVGMVMCGAAKRGVDGEVYEAWCMWRGM